MINSFQHIGLGVYNIKKTYDFYKKLFGFKVKLNDLTVTPEEMEPVIGSLETMHMLMAMNIKGGGLLEFIEHKSSPIRPFPKQVGYGDYGILEIGFGVRSIDAIINNMQMQGVEFLMPICEIELTNGRVWLYTYLKDPNGILIQLVEDLHQGESISTKPEIHGIIHVGIGVSNMEKSEEFYKDVLGFDLSLYSHQGVISELDPVIGKSVSFNMKILERSASVPDPVAVLPAGIIKLIHVPEYQGKHIYKNRRWGDIGCMEFCMDVNDLNSLAEIIEKNGLNVFLSPVKIDMGSGSKGLVAYIRDPDGTLIEFVEIKTVAWISKNLFLRMIMPFLKLYDRIIK